MKKLTVLTLLLLVLLGWGVPALAITWGTIDTVHTNVGAMVVDYPNHGPLQWCSGTLIHPRVFLTAGHCIEPLGNLGISRVWVNFDQYALNPKTMLDVSRVILHPDYNWGPTSNPHDVAVLILAKPVKKLKPATLASLGFLDTLQLREGANGAKFTVVGYGAQEAPGFVGEDKRRFAVSEFQALLNAWLRTSQNRATGDSGTCFGDSGGPAFWTQPDGSEVLVGLVSWGDNQCKATGFNYRVDIAETLNFINSVTANLK
jgi:secreted trypsin-like serine protease